MTAPTGDGPLRFEVLGPVRAYAGDRELDLGPLKQRAVLAALLLNVNETVSVSRLVDTVWPDNPPHNGPNVVQKYVAGLRRVLEPDRAVRAPAQRLLRSDGGYVLRVDPGGLDAERFAQLQGESVNGDPTLSISKLRLALDLWRGEPLAGLAGPAFAHARIRLSESRAVAAETLAETELAAGRHRESTADLTRLVADFPLRERPRYLLMLALHRSGRPAEALAVFDDGQRLLTEEFGIDPGARLLELRAEILGARTAEIVPRPAVTAVAPAGRLGWTWVRKVLAGLIPLVTFGLASWAVVLSAAVARRSWRLGLLAALFLVQAAAVVVAAIENYEPPSPLVAAVLSGAYVASILWGAIAGLLLVRAPAGWLAARRAPGPSGWWRRRSRCSPSGSPPGRFSGITPSGDAASGWRLPRSATTSRPPSSWAPPSSTRMRVLARLCQPWCIFWSWASVGWCTRTRSTRTGIRSASCQPTPAGERYPEFAVRRGGPGRRGHHVGGADGPGGVGLLQPAGGRPAGRRGDTVRSSS
ncbi:BTAD domain-containing putative transcriptional regulator [Fodinicola feengrottensis]|uniref:BTAD domain-containing putative transcriptional regulator n=1 Tax=Fodinicola feengrottensis TaxID=435914 RepID=UPI0013D2E6BE|nr:BTAD domain-containing putative transcriptional regulator [Fodinicola feengrottensis]